MSGRPGIIVLVDEGQTDVGVMVSGLHTWMANTNGIALVLDWRRAETTALVTALDKLKLDHYLITVKERCGKGEIYGAIWNMLQFKINSAIVFSAGEKNGGVLTEVIEKAIGLIERTIEVPICHVGG